MAFHHIDELRQTPAPAGARPDALAVLIAEIDSAVAEFDAARDALLALGDLADVGDAAAVAAAVAAARMLCDAVPIDAPAALAVARNIVEDWADRRVQAAPDAYAERSIAFARAVDRRDDAADLLASASCQSVTDIMLKARALAAAIPLDDDETRAGLARDVLARLGRDVIAMAPRWFPIESRAAEPERSREAALA